MNIESSSRNHPSENAFSNSHFLTERFLANNPELEPKKINIEFSAPYNPELPVTVLLPGIVNSAGAVFKSQKDLLINLGQNVAYVEYSPNGFSQDLLQAQLLDFLNSLRHNQNFNFIGVSIGAREIIDVLSVMSEDQLERVNSVILLGLVYSDLDLKSDLFGRLAHIAGRVTPDQVFSKFSGLIKRYIKTDPLYDSEEQDQKITEKQVKDLSSQVIVDMFDSLSNSAPISNIRPFNGVKAGIGWWQDDHASYSARKRALALFDNPFEFPIKGHHGWTQTGAEDINSAIRKIVE